MKTINFKKDTTKILIFGLFLTMICLGSSFELKDDSLKERMINYDLHNEQTIVVPGNAFRPKDVQSGYPETFITGTIGLNGSGHFTYPIVLPVGSKITNVDFVYIDDKDPKDFGGAILASKLTEPRQIIVETFETRGAIDGIQTQSKTLNEIITGDKAYFFQVFLPERDVEYTFLGFKMTYELP